MRGIRVDELCDVGRSFELADHRVDAIGHAFVEIARLELRRDHVANDATRRHVGQRPFETVADFDSKLAILRRNDEENAVVLAFLPELPRLEYTRCVFLDALVADR